MNAKIALGLWIVATCSVGCGDSGKDSNTNPVTTATTNVVDPPSRIGFGSCVYPLFAMPPMQQAASQNYDMFIFLGDNMYADSEDETAIRAAYDVLGATAEFVALDASTDLYATWDDHDYGTNDLGKDHIDREGSQAAFMDFWQEPIDSERRLSPGVHTSYQFSGSEKSLQLIILDTRYFRDDLVTNDGSGMNDYIPIDDASRTLLGDAQWTWLEGVLQEPADLRIIASSIQFGHSYNGYESWNNLTAEKQRMVDLIDSTGAQHVVFISGDVHWGEFSIEPTFGNYPLYDFTSSAISRPGGAPTPNTNRVGDPIQMFNYGEMLIDWAGESLTVSLIDGTGNIRLEHTVSFSEIEG